ncbi:metallophosphatase [Bacteroidia bacterium]|nr:metallophosphatase [Bacteroidia bacterium]
MKYKIKITTFFLIFAFILNVNAQEKKKIIILHSNDTHSQVEPTDHRSKEPDMGGYARRMGVIDSIRNAEQNVLLLDAGDFWQGTPYFNFFNGRVEIDAMNRMKYDVATLGNHEFDNGMDTLALILQKANFQIVDANYDVSATVLRDLVKPYVVLERFGVRIGVFGLSPDPHGLVFEKNYRGIIFKDPIKTAVAMSNYLKKKEKCDLIICLSHIGTEDLEQYDNDFKIARASTYIDVIIGGHSHTLVADNTVVPNKKGKFVVLSQMGKSGLYLGKIELELIKK